MTEQIVWDFQKGGPWCTSHRSPMCQHALDEIEQRADVPHLEAFLVGAAENAKDLQAVQLKLAIPLWPSYHMWETLTYKVKDDDVIGSHAVLQADRSARGETQWLSPYHEGVARLLPGEGIIDLSKVMLQQFGDILELEWEGPAKGAFSKGCRSGNHTMVHQNNLEALYAIRHPDGELTHLLPHLFGLRSRGICAYCWADMYGGEARRVSGTQQEPPKEELVDFGDLIPDDTHTTRRRPRFT